jgi:hypothetical protein
MSIVSVFVSQKDSQTEMGVYSRVIVPQPQLKALSEERSKCQSWYLPLPFLKAFWKHLLDFFSLFSVYGYWII